MVYIVCREPVNTQVGLFLFFDLLVLQCHGTSWIYWYDDSKFAV